MPSGDLLSVEEDGLIVKTLVSDGGPASLYFTLPRNNDAIAIYQ